MKARLYYCSICKSVLEEITNVGHIPCCCGKRMPIITPEKYKKHILNKTDALEKRKLNYVVCIAEKENEGDKVPSIEWIEIVTNMGIHRYYLKNGELPMATFRLNSHEKLQEVYAISSGYVASKNVAVFLYKN